MLKGKLDKISGTTVSGWGSIATVVLGVLFLFLPLGKSLSVASYSWLFRLRSDLPVREERVIAIAMDQDSTTLLRQSAGKVWNRELHARLVRELTRLGARVVAFDVFFEGATPEDGPLLEAAEAHGSVIFAGLVGIERTPSGEPIGRALRVPFGGGIDVERVGLVESTRETWFRRHQRSEFGVPSLAWRVGQKTVADLPAENGERWINYYGPPGTIRSVSYVTVISNTIPPDASFSNAVVFVGAVAKIGPQGGRSADYFDTPYGELMPGVEVNATVYLNLLRGDWLHRMNAWLELIVVMLFGAGLPRVLGRLHPLTATGLAAGVALLLGCGAWLLFAGVEVWFAWLIPGAIQLPSALAWSMLAHARRLDLQKGILEEEKRVLQKELATAVSGRGSATSAPIIPDFTLLRCVGRGAYGEVWLGRDVVGNLRAVKIIYRATFSSEVPYEREFKGIERFSPLSRTHPGWVDVLHVGRNDEKGYFFYVMEPADDVRLGQMIEPERYVPKTLQAELERRGRFELRECLDLSLALASALDHLHRHSLVHRDIKPANVIFVKGQPKFVDIGLITETAGTKDDVSWIGTEGYMPPEGPGAPAADVYGLGKLIYEVGMGRDRRAFPELPTAVLESEPGEGWDELNAIILTACETDVSKRFQSAAALHAALLRLYGQLRSSGN